MIFMKQHLAHRIRTVYVPLAFNARPAFMKFRLAQPRHRVYVPHVVLVVQLELMKQHHVPLLRTVFVPNAAPVYQELTKRCLALFFQIVPVPLAHQCVPSDLTKSFRALQLLTGIAGPALCARQDFMKSLHAQQQAIDFAFRVKGFVGAATLKWPRAPLQAIAYAIHVKCVNMVLSSPCLALQQTIVFVTPV